MIRQAVLLVLLFSSLSAWAQERETLLSPLRIEGGGEADLIEALRPERVSKDKLERQQQTDLNRVLKQVSGVYIREEDGQGLRPNIGLRGTNPDRSKKVIFMEDGILIGPAPYSAPAAYYVPSLLHVESVEVFKGFAALPYGPNSVGGAVNLVTPSWTETALHRLEWQGGSFASQKMKVSTSGPNSFGSHHLQVARVSSDGFKVLDGGGRTGYAQNDALVKLRWVLNEEGESPRELSLILGAAEEDSAETYLGLSSADFEQNSRRRYRASSRDRMTWQHQKWQLHYSQQVGEQGALQVALYQHRFHRLWERLDRVRDSSQNLRDIVRDPTGSRATFLAILKGEQDSSALGVNGELGVVNNDRSYLSQGIQARWFELLGEHKLEAQVRFHQDEIRRNHTLDYYEMISGQMLRGATARQQETLNRDQAESQSLMLRADLQLEPQLILTPVLRFERVNFDSQDDLSGKKVGRRDEVWIPGAALTRRWSSIWSSRVSFNRAATLSGLSLDGSEKREDALNFELETKASDPGGQWAMDLTYFKNDYQNLIGTCSSSSGCNANQIDKQFNAGAVQVRGLEARAGRVFPSGSWDYSLEGRVTWLEATFQNDFVSNSSEWGAGQVRVGDPLPYVPRWLYQVNLGLQRHSWSQELSIVYQSAVYDQSAASGRDEIPAFGLLDWNARYQLSKNWKLTGKIDNLLKRDYAVSARPFGLRPGKPQAFQVGLSADF